MVVQLALGAFIGFVLLISLLVFFVKHQHRAPYYQLDAKGCVAILNDAVNGDLLEYEWHIFIGMTVRYDAEIEALRCECACIDDEFVINTFYKDGKAYVVFAKEGLLRLQTLLDEWQHKVDYLA
ncbi:hypothetical protein DN730_17960 [Marinomonas piezotolerans]|uniref:Uncharacterized protein n=1 Tax=Marinomonas piezotolerans TaxID=2213058 RepID=A0A370U4L8_9GAMM|nr:hypothetical protein [Marinomonas piezotolerans]RDL42716.1 hypothetical protein DN730_17960 [Marinomonas piezotolerans]